jgi:hypothetical protein
MATYNTGDRISLKAAADYSTKQFYLVKQTAEDTATLAGAGEDVIGAIQDKPKAGQTASIAAVHAGSTFKVILGATVVLRAPLKSDANGAAITAVSTNKAFGRALQAGVAGDIIEVAPGYETV